MAGEGLVHGLAPQRRAVVDNVVDGFVAGQGIAWKAAFREQSVMGARSLVMLVIWVMLAAAGRDLSDETAKCRHWETCLP